MKARIVISDTPEGTKYAVVVNGHTICEEISYTHAYVKATVRFGLEVVK